MEKEHRGDGDRPQAVDPGHATKSRRRRAPSWNVWPPSPASMPGRARRASTAASVCRTTAVAARRGLPKRRRGSYLSARLPDARRRRKEQSTMASIAEPIPAGLGAVTSGREGRAGQGAAGRRRCRGRPDRRDRQQQPLGARLLPRRRRWAVDRHRPVLRSRARPDHRHDVDPGAHGVLEPGDAEDAADHADARDDDARVGLPARAQARAISPPTHPHHGVARRLLHRRGGDGRRSRSACSSRPTSPSCSSCASRTRTARGSGG